MKTLSPWLTETLPQEYTSLVQMPWLDTWGEVADCSVPEHFKCVFVSVCVSPSPSHNLSMHVCLCVYTIWVDAFTGTFYNVQVNQVQPRTDLLDSNPLLINLSVSDVRCLVFQRQQVFYLSNKPTCYNLLVHRVTLKAHLLRWVKWISEERGKLAKHWSWVLSLGVSGLHVCSLVCRHFRCLDQQTNSLNLSLLSKPAILTDLAYIQT